MATNPSCRHQSHCIATVTASPQSLHHHSRLDFLANYLLGIHSARKPREDCKYYLRKVFIEKPNTSMTTNKKTKLHKNNNEERNQ